jgi:hypothetical protein
MRKLILIWILSSAVCSLHAQPETPRKMVRKDYSLSIPYGWLVDSSGVTGADIFLVAPHKDANPKFRENVNVMLQDLALLKIDLEGYKAFSEEQVLNMKDSELHLSEIVNIGGNAFYKLHFSFTMGEIRLQAKAYCVIKNSIAYLVTYTAEAKHYDIYSQEAEAVLNSFELR